MDTTTLLLLGAAAYWFLIRPTQPGAPITGRSSPAGGTQITIPGYATYIPGQGTAIQIDPRLFTLFGGGSAQPVPVAEAPAGVYGSPEPFAAIPHSSPPSDPFYQPPSEEQLDICWSDPYNPVCYGGAI